MGEPRPSIYQLARAIKRDDVGLWHCLQSIDADTRFVQEVRCASSEPRCPCHHQGCRWVGSGGSRLGGEPTAPGISRREHKTASGGSSTRVESSRASPPRRP
jgi:hypothetical protein